MAPDARGFTRKHSLVRLLQRVPGLRALISRIRPVWYFKITLWSVTISSWFWPHTKGRARFFREVLRGHFSPRELSSRTRRYLYHARLVKDIEIAWMHWGDRYADWITVDGESHLRSALAQGKGAILISPHNFGYSKIVAPVLAARGFRIHRGGNGGKKAQYRIERWNLNGEIGWHYLSYKGDYWHRVQLLKSIQQLLNANQIVHISPRAYGEGEERFAIEVFGRKYYLDAGWFRIFRICGAPLLPCFAVSDLDGRFTISIHPALSSSDESSAQEFSRFERDYITDFPECGRLWKSLYLERAKW